jgi:chromosome condensin MukBEF ATPase and DNA-binding subunit MukB
VSAVKSKNPPTEAENAGTPETPQHQNQIDDYEDMVMDGDFVNNSRENNAKQTAVVGDKTGETRRLEQKYQVPKEVMSQLRQRVRELEDSKKMFDMPGYQETSTLNYKQNAIDALNKFEELLNGTEIGLQQAQVFFGTLASMIWDALPSALVNYLGTARNTKTSFGAEPEVE